MPPRRQKKVDIFDINSDSLPVKQTGYIEQYDMGDDGSMTPGSKELRKVLHEKRKIEWILGLQIYPRIHQELMACVRLGTIATWMMEDDAVKRIGHSRPKIISDLKILRRNSGAFLQVHDEQVREDIRHTLASINTAKDLEELYNIQKERVMMEYTTEKSIKKTFKTTREEIELLYEIIKGREAWRLRFGEVHTGTPGGAILPATGLLDGAENSVSIQETKRLLAVIEDVLEIQKSASDTSVGVTVDVVPSSDSIPVSSATPVDDKEKSTN